MVVELMELVMEKEAKAVGVVVEKEVEVVGMTEVEGVGMGVEVVGMVVVGEVVEGGTS
jgi:hypothetical protein